MLTHVQRWRTGSRRDGRRLGSWLCAGFGGALTVDLALAVHEDLESHTIQNAAHGCRCEVPCVTNRTRKWIGVGALGIMQAFLGRHGRTLESGHDVGQADGSRRPGQRVAAAWAAIAAYPRCAPQ